MAFSACPERRSCRKHGQSMTSRKLLTISELATAQISQRLLTILMFLGVLLEIVGMVAPSLHMQPINLNSTSLMLRNRFCVTGLLTEVTLHVLSTKELCFESWNGSLERSHPRGGTVVFSGDTPMSVWENLLDLTQSVLSASTKQSSMSILFSSGRSWIGTKYHGEMSITWMRKAVSGEADAECRPSNTLFLATAALNTSCGV